MLKSWSKYNNLQLIYYQTKLYDLSYFILFSNRVAAFLLDHGQSADNKQYRPHIVIYLLFEQDRTYEKCDVPKK